MLAKQFHADIIVLGIYGRKGRQESNYTVLGQAVSFMAQQPRTVAVLKDTNMQTVKQHYRFGALFDGSEVSCNALRKAMTIMADVDRLSVITVFQPSIDEEHVRTSLN